MRIIHLFGWRLSDVLLVLDDVKEQGFDAIQINPLQPLKEDGFDNWWLVYQPCGFDIGNQYGSKWDLNLLCEEAHKRELKIYADVICTHVAGMNNGELIPHEKVDKRLVDNPYLWREKTPITDWESREQVLNYCAGLPSFNLDNWDLQDIIICFLNELINCGVDGFRFDSAKSIRTPSEGCNFLERVLGSLSSDVYNYGEVLFADDKLISLYSDYMDVLTNNWGKNKEKLVLFVESHDSYYGLGYTKNKTSKEVMEDYGHLTENYPQTIYFVRDYDNTWRSEDIKKIHTKVLKR